MAEDLNKVFLIGRLTRDAELQYTNSGYPLCKMSIAVNRRRKSGEAWVDEGNFFDVTLWGKSGEALNNYLKKGKQIGLEGQLRQERWEQDGMKRSKVTIEAVNIQLLGSKGDSFSEGRGEEQGSRPYSPPAQSTPPPAAAEENFEDDIPF